MLIVDNDLGIFDMKRYKDIKAVGRAVVATLAGDHVTILEVSEHYSGMSKMERETLARELAECLRSKTK